MKRTILFLFAFCSMFVSSLSVNAQDEIILTPSRVNNEGSGNGNPRGPIYIPTASIDGHTFYISNGHPDYVLQVVDPDDETNVVYEILVPAGVNSVVLPSWLVGEYVIQLLWSDWRFWGYIELE